MIVRLTQLLSVLALCAATPVLADTTGGVSMSAPPNFSGTSSSQATPPDTSSSEMSHMTTPPNFGSSSSDATPPDMSSMDDQSSSTDDQTSSEAPPDDTTSSDQPAGPPVASADALKLFYDTCTDLSGGDLKAYDRANSSGWTQNEQDDAGPYNSIYSGYRNMDGYGEVDIWGSLNSYPTQQLGYCRVDFTDTDNLINFADMTKLGGLKGRLEDRGDGNVYGAWEAPDHKLLVIGDRNGGQVEIEFNLLLGDKKK